MARNPNLQRRSRKQFHHPLLFPTADEGIPLAPPRRVARGGVPLEGLGGSVSRQPIPLENLDFQRLKSRRVPEQPPAQIPPQPGKALRGRLPLGVSQDATAPIVRRRPMTVPLWLDVVPGYYRTPFVVRRQTPTPPDDFLGPRPRLYHPGEPEPFAGRAWRHRLPLDSLVLDAVAAGSRRIRQAFFPDDLLNGRAWFHGIFHTGLSLDRVIPLCPPPRQRADEDCEVRVRKVR